MMTSKKHLPLLALASLLLALVCTAGCGLPPDSEAVPLPTAPSTLPEVIDALSSDSDDARITAAYAVPEFGEAAVAAIPALVENLHRRSTEVREAAAVALGRLGPDARDAVPDLIGVLRDGVGVHMRIAAADALGRIGEPSSVPALAATLYEEAVFGRSSISLDISCAVSITQITGQSFPDADSQGGYQLDEEGVPLVVIAAREWWESEGIHQAWPAIDE